MNPRNPRHYSSAGLLRNLSAALLLGGLATSCSIKKVAVNQLGDALAAGGTTFASDDDPDLGIIFLANMELGFLAPPVGLNLLLSSYRFNKPMTEVMRSVLPMLAVLFIGVLLITYFPPLTTFLPRLLK